MSDTNNPGAVVENNPGGSDNVWDKMGSGSGRSDLNSTPAPDVTSLPDDVEQQSTQSNTRDPRDAADRLSNRKKNISAGVDSAFGRFGNDLMNTGWNR